MHGLLGAVFLDQVQRYLEPTKRRALIRLPDSSAVAPAECHKAGLDEQRLPRLCAVEASAFSKVVGPATSCASAFITRSTSTYSFCLPLLSHRYRYSAY